MTNKLIKRKRSSINLPSVPELRSAPGTNKTRIRGSGTDSHGYYCGIGSFRLVPYRAGTGNLECFRRQSDGRCSAAPMP